MLKDTCLIFSNAQNEERKPCQVGFLCLHMMPYFGMDKTDQVQFKNSNDFWMWTSKGNFLNVFLS